MTNFDIYSYLMIELTNKIRDTDIPCIYFLLAHTHMKPTSYGLFRWF